MIERADRERRRSTADPQERASAVPVASRRMPRRRWDHATSSVGTVDGRPVQQAEHWAAAVALDLDRHTSVGDVDHRLDHVVHAASPTLAQIAARAFAPETGTVARDAQRGLGRILRGAAQTTFGSAGGDLSAGIQSAVPAASNGRSSPGRLDPSGPRVQRMEQTTVQDKVLDSDDLCSAVLTEFAKWDKATFYGTGVTGPTPDQKTVQHITTTKDAFKAAVDKVRAAMGAQGYHVRFALSKGEGFQATDILISTDPNFSNAKPKMVFHIWGKYN